MERCAQTLNQALHALFEENGNVFLLGEDILDPYGGAFKISAGLSTRWPDRVLATPLSEAAFTGMAVGMAMRGLRPIVEIMFGDFLTLCFDQILNHATKFEQMYDGKATCPLVIRTPMGGRRGYGPTHSQSLEKFFIGMPGLSVVAPSRVHPLGELLKRAVVETDHPVIFIENKAMYGQENTPPSIDRVGDFYSEMTAARYPMISLSLNNFQQSDITLITYGGMAGIAMEAAMELAIEEEIFLDILLPAQISPLDVADFFPSIRRSKKVIVVEEGTKTAGWGAEVVSALMEECPVLFTASRVAAADSFIPSSRTLEDVVLPQKEDILRAALNIMKRRPER